MGAPIEPPGDFPHWIIDAIIGVVSAATTAGWFIWRAATAVADMRKDLKEQRESIDMLERDVDGATALQAKLHLDNLREMSEIREIVAKQPDKEDFRQLTNQIAQLHNAINRR